MAPMPDSRFREMALKEAIVEPGDFDGGGAEKHKGQYSVTPREL